MPESARTITAEDLIPDSEFAGQRSAWRARLLPKKRLRRIALGPHCTFYFECFDTMLFQIQEMLLIEKGGEEQIQDELAAYNPLIPSGRELVATVMFEIDEPIRRTEVLGRLGGVERSFFLQVGNSRMIGVPDSDAERSREDGKTSSVHFLRFPMSDEDITAFRDPDEAAMIGCADPRYGHIAMLTPETRTELSGDLIG